MPLTMFMNNSDGLNLTDSPLTVKDTQASGQSYNYDYNITGAITKVLSNGAINSVADAQLKTLGLAVHHDASTDARTVIRTAGTKIQTFDTSSGAFTNLSADTASPTSTFLDSTSTQPVVFAPFNTSTVTHLWMAGGGLSSLVSYNGTSITSNGVAVPTGSFTATRHASGGGSFAATGAYFYSIAFRKSSSQAISNAGLDVTATVSSTDDKVTLDWSGLTNYDATLYDKVYIYRSAVSGVTSFTTGDLIAQVSTASTSYDDKGSYISTAQNIPRAGNTLLDNSVLPSGTFKSVVAFKRRLITAANGTLYISDLDKPESWPLTNRFVLSSGGPITALGTLGVPSEYTTGADQYCCIWKENEIWVLTGDSTSNWEFLFVDRTGCLGQSLVVPFNGFITWLTYNGIYLWDGKGRPSRCSRPIQAMFGVDGDLDKSRLSQGYGAHYRKGNQVIWRLSHRTKGTQKLSLKMDTRLSAIKMFQASPSLQNPELDGVFIQDTDSNGIYALASYQPSGNEEQFLMGDDAGYVYQGYSSASTAVSFAYETRPLDMGIPQRNKRFKRVLVFVEKLTTNDLTLYYWADSRTRDEYSSKAVVSLAPSKGTQPALWDVALWDQAYWDDYTPDISPVEFQLHSYDNNAEGNALRLRFVQAEASAPVRIHGFAIEWEDMGDIPIPSQQI